MTKSISFVVKGRVQGVGFRYAAGRQAKLLELTGWIRNNQNGTVEGVIQGSDEKIQLMLGWLHKGPSSAYVIEVESDEAINQLYTAWYQY